jgi:hypothetical protein
MFIAKVSNGRTDPEGIVCGGAIYVVKIPIGFQPRAIIGEAHDSWDRLLRLRWEP